MLTEVIPAKQPGSTRNARNNPARRSITSARIKQGAGGRQRGHGARGWSFSCRVQASGWYRFPWDFCWWCPPPRPRPRGRHKARKVLSQQSVLPPAPRGPLPQVPLDQLPAAPPQVNYQDGRLTIVAQNSTLGDILREVRKRTGASIEVPPSATERVVARLGPAPARDVPRGLAEWQLFQLRDGRFSR